MNTITIICLIIVLELIGELLTLIMDTNTSYIKVYITIIRIVVSAIAIVAICDLQDQLDHKGRNKAHNDQQEELYNGYYVNNINF